MRTWLKTGLENLCDSRAATANLRALNSFAQSGSRYHTFGTHETWPGYDTVNAANSALLTNAQMFYRSLTP